MIALVLGSACGDDSGGNTPEKDAGPPPMYKCSGTCHGDEASNAPPVGTMGETETTARGVGAHRSHLDSGAGWHRVVECRDCHLVPVYLTDPGHMDTPTPAEVTFGQVAQAQGANPTWDGQGCSGVYCHGGTMTGGALSEPNWTTVDGTQAACGNCHALPPPAPHPAEDDCGSCHKTIRADLAGPPGPEDFLAPERHIDGTVDF